MDDNRENQDPALPESLGGIGGPSVKEWRLLEKAIRERWDVPVVVFRALPSVAARYAAGQDQSGERIVDPRTGKPISLYQQFTAMKILMEMKKQNTDTARLEIEAARQDHRSADVNVNVGVHIGNTPVAEIVVNDRDEVRQFGEIRERLIEAVGKNGDASSS